MSEDITELGYISVDESAINDSVDVVLLDCRNLDAVRDPKYLKSDKIVIAIIGARIDLPTEVLSEFADIVFYPCSKEELFARIHMAAYRLNKDFTDDIYELNGFKINFTNYEVMVSGKRLDLTYKEYELLRHLATAPGRVFTRSQLLKNVWGYDYIEGARTVDVHIRRLRSKLGNKYAPLIETVRHVGYRFKRTSL